MSKDQEGDSEHLDTLRHEDVVEREEQALRDYPRVVSELEAAKKKLADTEARLEVQERLGNHLAKANTKLQLETKRLKEFISGTRTGPTKLTSGKCKYCNEKILWGKTKMGKPIPLEVRAVLGQVVQNSPSFQGEMNVKGIILCTGYDDDGNELTIALVEPENPALAKRVHPTHFGYCGAKT